MFVLVCKHNDDTLSGSSVTIYETHKEAHDAMVAEIRADVEEWDPDVKFDEHGDGRYYEILDEEGCSGGGWGWEYAIFEV